jgi:1,4-alpha-glucan branching enzyme
MAPGPAARQTDPDTQSDPLQHAARSAVAGPLQQSAGQPVCPRGVQRAALDPRLLPLAQVYREQFSRLRRLWTTIDRDLVGAFGKLQALEQLEIITCAATHALLPLLADHEPSVRAQIFTARDHYRDCFGCDPRGIWLPECAYVDSLEPVLKEAGLHWFTLERHGVLHATPQPRYSIYAPLITPHGLAAFGRDPESARQVWSRTEGYPGDPRYRDFYRDIGYDLDFDYVRPCLPSPEHRGFTGIKYHRITGTADEKAIYDREAALEAVTAHAAHFIEARLQQVHHLAGMLGRPPLILMPYDAELFGHWWHEGVAFIDAFLRGVCRRPNDFQLTTPGDYLRGHPTHQVSSPAASSWGEHGYYQVWLNETNHWILPHLDHAQQCMTQLARQFKRPSVLQKRALNQAARELMLAQASDWPFILRTGTSPGYARQRVEQHLLRFNHLHEQLHTKQVDAPLLTEWEAEDNLFPNVDFRHFR